MADIFISHSKKDAETIAAFSNVFARTNIRAILAEFEAYAIPPWLQIRNYVQQSSALFLLLSPHLAGTPYTQNWVSYEVGLACALNKPVWVYEAINSATAMFPVPYFTDYVFYDPRNRQHLNVVKQFVESYDPNPSIVGAALGALIGAVVSGGAGAGLGALIGGGGMEALRGTQHRSLSATVKCPHATCGISFRLYSRLQQMACPACRQGLTLNWANAQAGSRS
jgi:hypothetical protein